MTSAPRTVLPIIELVDNFRQSTSTETFASFVLPNHSGSDEVTIGLIPEAVLPHIRSAPDIFSISSSPLAVRFVPSLNTFEARSAAISTLCKNWRDEGLFKETIGPGKWRDELYPVYFDPFKRKERGGDELAFVMERTCCALFGLVTYGVHMNMYQKTENGSCKFWVPRRAKTKPTWGGYLDNTVAGGLTYGLSPTDAMIKECFEEASLPASFVRPVLRPVGMVSYFYQTKEGWLQPEIQYLFDLEVPSGASAPPPPELKPSDGEVESFEIHTMEKTLELMHRGDFKPNCALVLVEFMMRHGYITPELELNYLDIVTRIHGRFWLD